MITEHYLTKIDSSYELDSPQSICKKMEEIFLKNERLFVLLDETLAPKIFDDLKQNFRDENIIYVPLAKGNSYKDTDLFFLEITKKEILEKVGLELAEHFAHNLSVSNDQYLVHGFGTSTLENEILNQRFKKSLVLEDIESKFLFRWYDPRVMIYLDEIFDKEQLNRLFGIFENWHFMHPKGYFFWENNNQEEYKMSPIAKINIKQSLALDLVEISNLVFQKLVDFDDVDFYQVEPQKILKNLYEAHEKYQITKYLDLVSYGLYAEVLGRNFIKNHHVEEVLKQYWLVEPQNYTFTEAMNFVPEQSWALIKTEILE